MHNLMFFLLFLRLISDALIASLTSYKSFTCGNLIHVVSNNTYRLLFPVLIKYTHVVVSSAMTPYKLIHAVEKKGNRCHCFHSQHLVTATHKKRMWLP